MNEKNFKKILERLEVRYQNASKADKQRIKELEKVIKDNAPHFHIDEILFPKEMRISNLEKDQKIHGQVEIKEFPELQKIEGKVEIKNWPKIKDIQKVEILNFPEQKEMEKPSWVDSIIDSMLTKLASLLATVAAKTVEMMVRSNLTVEFLRPQPVIMVDARGKALKFNEQPRQTTTVISGGSSTASSAVSDPVTGYKVADTDESGTVKYYGFINKAGAWYVMKNDTTTNTFRFSKGSSNYPTGWTGRAALTYDYFNIIFA